MDYLGVQSRSPHGERGLKYLCFFPAHCLYRRSPHGERGLKYSATSQDMYDLIVALLTESVD